MNLCGLSSSPRRFCAGFFLWAIVAVAAGCGGMAIDNKNEANTLRMTTSRIRGFDPAHAGDQASIVATGRIYEGLLQYSYLDRPYRVEPLLAAAMPAVSEDGLVWRIEIRKGIYFSDDPCFAATGGTGRELVAQDLVYSIQRIADVKVGSGGFWAFRGKIKGLDDFRAASQGDAPTDYGAEIEGLRAIGSHEIEIRLTQPYPQLAWVLAMPYAFAVPREAVEFYGPQFVNHPVGTGPYVLASARQNYRYEYRRNPKWKEMGRGNILSAAEGAAHEAERLPRVERIVDVVVGDPSTAWLMFMSGQLDMVEVSRDQWDSIITPEKYLRPELAARGIVLNQSPQLHVSYTAFNMDDPVVGSNKKLRQALSCAFDSVQWMEFQNGRIMTPTGPVPPGVAGHMDSAMPYSFDLERAKRLLAEAGYPGGKDPKTGRRLVLTLELGSADNPEARQAAELMGSFMERIGVVIEPSYNNWPAFLQKISRRQAQMFSLTWMGDYPDAQNFLQLFASENASPGPNRANFAREDFDRLYQEMVAMPESSEREELCRKAAAVVLEDCPWIFTAYPMAFTVCRDRLINYRRHDFAWGMEKYWDVREAIP